MNTMLALAYCKHIHAPTTQSHEDFEGRSTCTFRFWTDERRFKGPGGKCVVQEALFQAGALQNMHMFTCDWVIHDPVLVYPSIKAILTVCFNSMYTKMALALATGGARTGGYPKSAPIPGRLFVSVPVLLLRSHQFCMQLVCILQFIHALLM